MSTNKPIVTIVMATYNGETFLEEQLLSIVNQSYENIELLVADDCSIDGSYEILTNYALKYKWIQILQNREQLGLVKNFEKLLELANGDYIAFCDQDDVWKKDKIQKAVEALQKEDNAKPLLFHSDLTVTNEKLEVIAYSYFSMRYYSFRKHKQIDVILGRCGVMGNTLVINQKLKSKVLPFPDDLKAHDYWIALINELFGKRLTSFESMVYYRLHQRNSSNTLRSINGERITSPDQSQNEVNLPFFNINRERILKYLLQNYELKDGDRKIILKFIDYMEFKKSRLYLIYLIFRYDFLRDNFPYRLKIAGKILRKKDIKHPGIMKNSFYLHNILSIFSGKETPFRGWGRKNNGQTAVARAQFFKKSFMLYEDGFIRSIGLGINGSPSFSIVEDDLGIYYDATSPSKLEVILGNYQFDDDPQLIDQAQRAIEMIKMYKVSKYNGSRDLDHTLCDKYDLHDCEAKRILVVAQRAGDVSLKFGMAEQFTTLEMINAAIKENPYTTIYLKIHPDVLIGGKDSDISIDEVGGKCIVINDDINPVSLLGYFDKVYTKTSQMGFEALLLGKQCVCFGMPFYAGWGVTDDKLKCERRKRKLKVEEIFAAAYILYTKYYNPYSQRDSDIFDTIKTIVKYRNRDKNIDGKIFCFGFSLWKHHFMNPFFKNIHSVIFINPISSESALESAIKRGLNKGSRIYIWGKKEFDGLEQHAKDNSIEIVRVEDGFIRSIGLGSDLTQPYSLVFDSRGIYFDPTQESDLEHILNYHDFSDDELYSARRIRQQLIDEKISKYNTYENTLIEVPKNHRVLLVPGQVEDDASLKYGAPEMNNLKLLQKARKSDPEAYILYKPHPDVLAGNKKGEIEDKKALFYCNRIIKEISLDSALVACDEVHTMTSLVGFEALMRGKKVFTYGLPFYAGWGLSQDAIVCERRQRVLTIDELTAATLLLYPRYIDPLSKVPCEIEITLKGLEQEKVRLKRSIIYRTFMKIRNIFSRRLQHILRFLNKMVEQK